MLKQEVASIERQLKELLKITKETSDKLNDVYELISKCSKGEMEETAKPSCIEVESNAERTEVIESAKAFVNANGVGGFEVTTSLGTTHTVYTNLITNSEERVVIALLKDVNTNKVVAKGVSKCNLNDVYNRYIGEAIALGRALGADVRKFENAPRPKGIPKGVSVDVRSRSGKLQASGEVENYNKLTGELEFSKIHNARSFITIEMKGRIKKVNADKLKIIDDTHAIYDYKEETE